MIDKLANIIEMIFKIPESEKRVARQAISVIQKIISKLKKSKDYLNIIYDPFKKYEEISGDKLQEKQGLINRFKDKLKENYEDIITDAFMALKLITYFDKDPEIMEINGSLKDQTAELKNSVEQLSELLDNLTSPDLRESVVQKIEEIQDISDQLDEFLKDRLIEYLTKNILAETWVQDLETNLNSKIEEKTPLVTQLFNERQQALDGVPQIAKRPQSLNPALMQRVWYPTDARQSEYVEPHEDFSKGHQ